MIDDEIMMPLLFEYITPDNSMIMLDLSEAIIVQERPGGNVLIRFSQFSVEVVSEYQKVKHDYLVAMGQVSIVEESDPSEPAADEDDGEDSAP